MRDPALEFLGLRLPRLHHKTVKTRFADDIRLLPATNRIDDFSSTDSFLIKHFDGLSWIAKVKDAHTIFEHEPGSPASSVKVRNDAPLKSNCWISLFIGFSLES